MIKRKIHDAEAQISQLEMQAEGWKREAARLKAENERLRAALEPFAKVARVFDEDVRSSNTPRSGAWYCWAKMVDGEPVDYSLTVEHMRSARAALAAQPAPKTEKA